MGSAKEVGQLGGMPLTALQFNPCFLGNVCIFVWNFQKFQMLK